MKNSSIGRFFRYLLAAYFAALCPFPLIAQETPPLGWSFELGEAFAAYHGGHFSESAEICRAVAASTRNETVRRDAEALSAMASMRMGSREESTSGRTRLGQVLRSDSRIVDRPDARLALGMARLTLNETSASLGELLGALEDFERAQRTPRVLETIVALADCWSRFNEWSLPVRGLPLTPPESPEAAAVERAKRVAELRAKAAKITGSEAALARIDVIVARQLLQRDETREDGMARLHSLARTNDISVSSEAAMLLAEQLTKKGAPADSIVPLYQFVAGAKLGERSRQAQQAAEDLLRRTVEFDVSKVSRADSPAPLHVSVANFAQLVVEVRRLDLAEFLARNKGMLVEALLPDDGALISSHAVTRPDGSPATRWSHDLSISMPAGAFVVLARDGAAPTGPAIGKTLVQVDSLNAVVLLGNRDALVAVQSDAACRAQFWMHGSFQPVEIPLRNGCAVFPLPPESRLVKDRRWVCLVRNDGGRMGLCRGVLPDAPLPEKGGAGVLVSAAPETPHVAEELLVCGWLADGLAAGAAPLRLDVELRDTMDELRGKSSVTVDATGTFSARFRAQQDWVGSTIHPVIRHEGAVLPSLFRMPLIRVYEPVELQPLIDVELGLLGIAQEGLLRGNLRARYPWGAPLQRGRAEMRFRAVRLPDAELLLPRLATPTLSFRNRLDAQGRATFAQPTAVFSLEAGKVAMNALFDVFGPESPSVSKSAERLFSEESGHLWLDPLDRSAIAGQPVHLRVGWFDPFRLIGGARPTLDVRGPAESEFATIPLFPDRGGYWTADWFPIGAGTHLVRIALPRPDGSLQETLSNIPVAPSQSRGVVETISFQTSMESSGEKPAVRVSAKANVKFPILAALLADQPLGATWLESETSFESRIALPRVPASGVNVALFSLENNELRCLGARWLAAPAELALRIMPADAEVSPGKLTRFDVECPNADLRGATVVARLADAGESGSVNWLLSEHEIGSSTPRFLMTSGHGGKANSAPAAPLLPSLLPVPSLAAMAMSRGLGLWSEVEHSAGEKVSLTIPLPAEPGQYRLSVMVRWRDGRQAVGMLPIDFSKSIAIDADLPTLLFAGDRTIASIRVENPGPQTRPIRLRTLPGNGLALEAWRVASGPNGIALKEEADALAIDLPARSELILTANFEATRAGRAVFQATLEAGAQRTRVERAYRVFSSTPPPQTAPSDSPMRIERRIFRLADVPPEPEELDPSKPALPRPSLYKLQRFPLGELDSIPLGTLLLVEDAVEFQRPVADLEWSQRAPSLTSMRDESDNSANAIAPVFSLSSREANYRRDSLGAGKYSHRFIIVVRRPGVCLLPAPIIRSKGETIRIQVEPAELRVRSID